MFCCLCCCFKCSRGSVLSCCHADMWHGTVTLCHAALLCHVVTLICDKLARMTCWYYSHSKCSFSVWEITNLRHDKGTNQFINYTYTRSSGALRAPNSSLLALRASFGPSGLLLALSSTFWTFAYKNVVFALAFWPIYNSYRRCFIMLNVFLEILMI